jgi:hypothetical protein
MPKYAKQRDDFIAERLDRRPPKKPEEPVPPTAAPAPPEPQRRGGGFGAGPPRQG